MRVLGGDVADQLAQRLLRVIRHFALDDAPHGRGSRDVETHQFVDLAKLVDDGAGDLALVDHGIGQVGARESQELDIRAGDPSARLHAEEQQRGHRRGAVTIDQSKGAELIVSRAMALLERLGRDCRRQLPELEPLQV
jgi:hypothetical protein